MYEIQVRLFYDVIWLIAVKIRLKMKSRSERYSTNRPRPRHGHKYTKYKMCSSIIMVTCTKQHLSNILSSIHEIVKGALSGLKQFLALQKWWKMLFISRQLFFSFLNILVLKLFKFLSWLFSHVAKRCDKKDKVNIKPYDVTAWLTNNYYTHTVHYLEK